MSLPGDFLDFANLEIESAQCAAFVAPDPDIAGIGVILPCRRKVDFSFEYSYLLKASSNI
jgi:hypothetical protein